MVSVHKSGSKQDFLTCFYSARAVLSYIGSLALSMAVLFLFLGNILTNLG